MEQLHYTAWPKACRFMAYIHNGDTGDIVLGSTKDIEEKNVSDYTYSCFGSFGSCDILKLYGVFVES